MNRPERPRLRWARAHPLVLILIVSGAALAGWFLLRSRKAKEPTSPPAVVQVETAVARIGTFSVTLDALGTVEPRPGHSALLAAPAPTQVLGVFVGIGDRVQAGEEVVQLDPRIWQARAQEAEIAFQTAEAAYERTRLLVAQGISPTKDLESAAATLAQARTTLFEAQALLAVASVRAPITGVVTRMLAALMEQVDVNQPLVEIIDPEALEVLFHISEEHAAAIRPGTSVRLLAGRDSAEIWRGDARVRGISAAIDTTTGSVAVRAAILTAPMPLKAGSSIGGRITLAEHPDVVIVPRAALVPSATGDQVFVIDTARIAHARPVLVGGRNDAEVEILRGLQGGETVATAGAYALTDSARVQVGGAR